MLVGIGTGRWVFSYGCMVLEKVNDFCIDSVRVHVSLLGKTAMDFYVRPIYEKGVFPIHTLL